MSSAVVRKTCGRLLARQTTLGFRADLTSKSLSTSAPRMGVYPSPVPTFHNATYPALSPHGRATGKVVVISGASGGIGRDVAMSFGKAGATKIVLLGRDQAKLVETRDAVLQIDGCEAEVHAFPVDLLDEVGMKRIAEDVGSWDVLVCSAGKGGRPKNVGDDVAGWWDVVEVSLTPVNTSSMC